MIKRNRRTVRLLSTFFLLLQWGFLSSQEISNAPPSQTPPIFVHYMPWFKTPEIRDSWGYHWTHGSINPKEYHSDGRRQIASHYYPLIGPYDSTDVNVLRYHALLMKASGIEGVFINWYGSHDVFDFRDNLAGSEAFVQVLTEVGLKYAFVYEDWTCGAVMDSGTVSSHGEALEGDMAYLNERHFHNSNYLKMNGEPVLLVFGPRLLKEPSQWTEALEKHGDPAVIPLWYHGEAFWASGFSWVGELEDMSHWYDRHQRDLEICIGSAFPRFNDYYDESGSEEGFPSYSDLSGTRLTQMLEQWENHSPDIIQLVTWNDFGEGTQIEPTREEGFFHLVQIQRFTGVDRYERDLQVILNFFLYSISNGANSQWWYEQLIQGNFNLP